MPAKSKSQQRLMGMVHAYKKGKLKKAPKKIKEVAKHISDEDARDFAKTKHDGLEEKKAFDFNGIMEKLEKRSSCAAIVSKDVLAGKPMKIVRDNGGMLQVVGPKGNDPKDAMVVSEDEIRRLILKKLMEKKAFDFAGIMAKLEKMAAGTKVVVYQDDQPVEFDSLTEAASFIAQQGAIPLSKVEKMLSQRQSEINGLRVEYPVAEESASGAESGVQELATAFKGLTGAYGSSSYGNVKLSEAKLTKKATKSVDESMFLPMEGEATQRQKDVAKLLVQLFKKHKKTPDLEPMGTLSRSRVSYDQLTSKDLEGAGFLPSLIAVPEKGQSQLTTYRHPLNGLHFHRHDDNWLFHDDTYASMQMLIKKYQLQHPNASTKDVLKYAITKAFPNSASHIIHEGGPGYVNWLYGSILGKPGFIDGKNPSSKRMAAGALGTAGGVMAASRLLTGKWNPITSAGITGGFLGSTALSNWIGDAMGAQPPGWKNTIIRAGLPMAGTVAAGWAAHKLQKAWNESVERKKKAKERKKRLKERMAILAKSRDVIGKAAEA